MHPTFPVSDRYRATPIPFAIIRWRDAVRSARRAGKGVERAMLRMKKGKLKRGKGGNGGTVKDRRQAIAIALSEARKENKKVLRKAPAKKRRREKKT